MTEHRSKEERGSATQRRDIRLIALDLDGTLLDDRKRIPGSNVKALRECHDRGCLIVLASGRMIPSMESAADMLGIDVLMIGYNGAVVCGTRAENRRRMVHQPLPADVAGDLIDFGIENGLLYNFYHEDRLYGPADPSVREFARLYSGRTGSVYNFLEDPAPLRGIAPSKFLYVTTPENRNRLAHDMAPAFGGRSTMVRTDPEYLEFLGPGVDKGSGLAELLRSKGLGREQAMAIGDGDNDAPMLRAAGLGVAMRNASPLCRSAADCATERANGDGGVAEAIERFLF